jgi:hypothetical protein
VIHGWKGSGLHYNDSCEGGKKSNAGRISEIKLTEHGDELNVRCEKKRKEAKDDWYF